MINLVVDANVLRALFEEDIGLPPPRPGRTGAAKNIAIDNTPSRRIALDDSGMIEHEYGNQCSHSPEWLDSWLSDGYQRGKIVLVDAKPHATNAKRVEQFGFPRGNRDLWYVKTALAIQQVFPSPTMTHLISEDIDLYDPSKKASPNKAKIIQSGKGPVSNHLKGQGIIVCCISTFNSTYP